MTNKFNSKDVNLNIAAVALESRALGPGLRMGIWVQGCPFRCDECISPEWQSIVTNEIVTPAMLSAGIIQNLIVDGITISGGEPMLQAEGLTQLIRISRKHKDLDVICFTGYDYHDLIALEDPVIEDFLREIDVLIDGPYIKDLNDDVGLRGSTNQKIYHLSSRLPHYDFVNHQRRVEVHVMEGELFLVGIPEHTAVSAFDTACQSMQSVNNKRLLSIEK